MADIVIILTAVFLATSIMLVFGKIAKADEPTTEAKILFLRLAWFWTILGLILVFIMTMEAFEVLRILRLLRYGR